MRGTKTKTKGNRGGGQHAELTDVKATVIHYMDERWAREEGKEGGREEVVTAKMNT